MDLARLQERKSSLYYAIPPTYSARRIHLKHLRILRNCIFTAASRYKDLPHSNEVLATGGSPARRQQWTAQSASTLSRQPNWTPSRNTSTLRAYNPLVIDEVYPNTSIVRGRRTSHPQGLSSVSVDLVSLTSLKVSFGRVIKCCGLHTAEQNAMPRECNG